MAIKISIKDKREIEEDYFWVEKMKIAFFETEKWEEEYVKKQLKNNKLIFFHRPISKKDLKKIKDLEILCIFIYSRITKDILSQLPNIKVIVTRSTGYDHIDVDECKKRKIIVTNIPSYGENTVAEHAFALILALSRKIHLSYERTKKGNFSINGLRGTDVKGKTLGIIGLGKIGKHVAKIAQGFEMNVLAYDIFKDENFAKENKIRYVPLDYLLKHSDIITLHTNLNEKTFHLINEKNINLIKKETLIINTAPGGLIETGALIKALENGNVGGAGLDVLEDEFMIKEESQLLHKNSKKKLSFFKKLLRMENVIITPHNAFNSEEAVKRILDTTLDNIICIMQNKECKNRVI